MSDDEREDVVGDDGGDDGVDNGGGDSGGSDGEPDAASEDDGGEPAQGGDEEGGEPEGADDREVDAAEGDGSGDGGAPAEASQDNDGEEGGREVAGKSAKDLKALHANIFGDDDSDDEDYAAHVEEEPTDERVKRILASGIRGKDKKGGERKRKGESDGKRRRLRKSGGGDAHGEEGSQRRVRRRQAAGSGEEGEEGEGGEESDEEGGPEAIEEGGAGDFDRILNGMKGRRGGVARSREMIREEVQDLQRRMEDAAERDNDNCKANPPQPAVHKVAMLAEVNTALQKRHLHEAMMDLGMFTTLAAWLKPMDDGSLVNLQVRTTLLRSISLFDVDETVLGSLRSSGIGKYVKLLSLHSKETPANKRQAVALMEKWTRPIFQSSVSYNAADVQVAVPRHTPHEMRAMQDGRPAETSPRADEPGQARKTGGGARVPRPVGMDFSLQPASSAQPLPSSKYHKESSRGKLQERMLGKRSKGGSTQAVTLSVEGRTLDRL